MSFAGSVLASHFSDVRRFPFQQVVAVCCNVFHSGSLLSAYRDPIPKVCLKNPRRRRLEEIMVNKDTNKKLQKNKGQVMGNLISDDEDEPPDDKDPIKSRIPWLVWIWFEKPPDLNMIA